MEKKQLARTLAGSVHKAVRRVPFPQDASQLPRLETSVVIKREAVDGFANFMRGYSSRERPGRWSSSDDGGVMPGGEARQYAAPAVLHQACFASSLGLLAHPALPVQPLGIVVVGQAWWLLQPVQAGEALRLTAQVSMLSRNSDGTRVSIRCELWSGDSLRYGEETEYLHKGRSGAECAVTLPEPGYAGERPTYAGKGLPDLRVEYGVNGKGRLDLGQRPAMWTARFSPGSARTWARLTGDANPIHTSRVAATFFGYRAVVLHGAAIDAWAADCHGITGEAPCSGAVSFRAPVLLPTELEIVDMSRSECAVIEKRSGRDLVHARYTLEDSATNGVRDPADHGIVPVSRSGLRLGSAPALPVPSESGTIVLPRQDGRLSSTVVSQGMCAAAAASVPGLQKRITEATPWRRTYREAMNALSASDAPECGERCAHDGLAAMQALLHFCDGRSLSDAAIVAGVENVGAYEAIPAVDEGFSSRELVLPMGRGFISGREIGKWLKSSEEAGHLQPGAAAALTEVVENPDILDLSGWTFACLGAGAELSLAPTLLGWGATVAAVIRPDSQRRTRLQTIAEHSRGTLYLSPEGASDLVREPERIAAWITGLPGRIVVVDTLYARGADFLLAAAGADVIDNLVCRARPDTVLAWIGSPADAYMMPQIPPAASLGAGNWAAIAGQYAKFRKIPLSRKDNVYLGFVDIQGPNYAAAKRIGRWRATVERAEGRQVSYNIAPMALTRSVLNTASLRAAYRGLKRLGMPPMPADTVATLMAALMAWDLAHPEAVRTSGSFFTDKAIDGGLFASPWEPDGLMGLAAGIGIFG